MGFPAREIAWWRCRRLARAGRYDQAIDLARRYAGRHPRHPRGWDLWASLLAQAKRWQEWESVLRQGLSANRGSDVLTFFLARSLMRQHRYGEAKGLLRELKLARPESALPYLGLTELSDELGGSIEEQRSLLLSAYERIERVDVRFHRMLGFNLLQFPDLSERGEDLLRDMLPRSTDAVGCLRIGLWLEAKDPSGANWYVNRARKHWPSSINDYLDEVEHVRESVRASQQHHGWDPLDAAEKKRNRARALKERIGNWYPKVVAFLFVASLLHDVYHGIQAHSVPVAPFLILTCGGAMVVYLSYSLGLSWSDRWWLLIPIGVGLDVVYRGSVGVVRNPSAGILAHILLVLAGLLVSGLSVRLLLTQVAHRPLFRTPVPGPRKPDPS